jgi:cytochrome P450
MDALAFLYDQFTDYVVDRRREPRDDVITGLATATFPDGSLPEPIEVVRIAAFLFAAGGETTARLLATSLRVLAEDPELQERLRGDRELLPNFIEETLRWEGPVKTDHRLTQVSTTIGGVDVPAGSTISMMLAAANRDPRRFENPDEFVADRPNARAHIAFGHGVHTCPGAPLARAEARVALERVLDRMRDIRISLLSCTATVPVKLLAKLPRPAAGAVCCCADGATIIRAAPATTRLDRTVIRESDRRRVIRAL